MDNRSTHRRVRPVGTALSQQPRAILQEMYSAWPFFTALLDNPEMSLLKADMGIAALYSALVPDRDLAERIFRLIRTEYDLTREIVLGITQHVELMEEDPVIQRWVQLRNPYVDPLNYIQVEMLKRLRGLPDQNGAEADALREVISVTINGIAAGLRACLTIRGRSRFSACFSATVVVLPSAFIEWRNTSVNAAETTSLLNKL